MKKHLFIKLSLLLLLVIWSTHAWGDQHVWNAWVKCDFNGSGKWTDDDGWQFNPTMSTGTLEDLGTLNSGSFTITHLKWKCAHNWDTWPTKAYAYMWYKINDGEAQHSSGQYYGNPGTEFYPYSGTISWSIANYTDPSGSYTFTCGFYCHFHWDDKGYNNDDLNNGGNNYKFTYKVAPPAVSDYTVTPTGALAGDGSYANPYIIAYNGTLQLDLSGASQAHSDANSTIKYSVDNSNWGTATANTRKTIQNITSTDIQNWVVYAKYQHKTETSLNGATNSKTIYYRAENRYNISATASPAAGGTVTPTSATATGQYSGGDITATPYFGYKFNGWTISSGSGYFGSTGTSTTSSTANTKFRPSAASTVQASFARMYAYVEANLQVYNSARNARTKTGNDWTDASTAIQMEYDGTNHRFFLHTYSTPAELAEQLNNRDAYFYIRTSTSSSSLSGGTKYYANGSGANQSLSAYGSTNKKAIKKDDSSNSFKFTGSEDAYVILYFDGDYVWYELECKVTYNGNANTGGTTPTDANYYAKGTTVTVASEPGSWAKSGYTFEGWNTANDGSGNNYTAGSGTFTINANTPLYAKWTQTVTLDENGGDTDGSVDVVYNGTTTSNLDVAERAGYTVEAYYAEPECTNKVLTDIGGLVNYSGYVESNKWVYSGAATLYTNWTPKSYTINLEDMEADDPGTESVSVTFDASTNMTSAIEIPTKAHYDFAGYYTSDDLGETLDDQLIDENGYWIADVTGYTGHDGEDNPTWVHDYPISLFAKWTETAYTITPSVYPAGSGSVNTVTDAHLITPSGSITATPANAAWIFDHWELGTHVGIAGGKGTTDNPITVTSDMNSTITAHFKPRYELRGDIWDGSGEGGMPGWSTGAAFTFNSFTDLGTGDGKGVDLSCSRTLNANTTYRFQIHDRITGNHGYATAATYIGDGESLLLNKKDENVMLAAIGAGTYTFRITNITEGVGDFYPTITIERPHQVNFGTGYAGIDNLSSVTSGTTGGTLDVTTSAGSLSTGDWVTYGTAVTYTPDAETGYTFEGFYTTNSYSYRFTTDNPWVHSSVTSDDNVYAKFEEISTAVTLSNDGHGHVEIGGDTETSTTCGVTTTRSITAVPDDGYSFSSWTTSSTPDFEVDDTNKETVTLTGHGAGTAGTLTANFSPISYTVTLNNDHGGSASDDGTATAVYDATALSSINNAQFEGWTLLGYWNADGNQVTDASGNLQSSVTNYTSSTGEWKYVGNVTLYAHWSRSVTLDREGGTTGAENVTVTYKGSSLSGFSAPSKTGYDFAGYYTSDNGTGTLVISTSGVLQANVSGYTNSDSQWTKADATTLYAKWTPKTYTAENNIDKNGGDSDGTYTATYGANKISIDTEPVYAGYEVEGYYFSDALNMKIAGADGTLVSGFAYDEVTYIASGTWKYDGYITLYPKWVPKTYTITLDANLGGIPGTNGSTSFTVTIGSNNFDFDLSIADRQSMTPPTKEGYTFAGYYDDPDEGEGTKVINSDGSKPSTSYVDSDGNWKCSTEPLTLYAHWTDNGTYYFKGGTSGNETSWNTASNWTKGQAPDDATDNVYILAPVVIPASATTSVNRVRIATNGSYTPTGSATPIAAAGKLTIPATAMLKVTTDVQNYDFSTSSASATTTATLHIQSASSGNGALVWGSASSTPGAAQVDFYTKSSAGGTGTGTTSDVNQYIGTPFSDESNYYNYYNSWVFQVNAAGTAWERLPMGSTMYPFVGYDVIYDGAAGHTFEMEGTLVTNADHTCTLTHNNDNDENLLANSWTAPMWIKGFEESDFTNADAAVYIFNSTNEENSKNKDLSPTGGNYTAYTPGTSDAYIPSMQSFSVLANGAGTGSVTLNYTNLVKTPAAHSHIGAMHAPRRVESDDMENEMTFLRLRVDDEHGWADELKIYIREDFVNEFENGFDARKMYGDPAAPMLYGISTDGMMAIHCIPTADNQVIGFHAGTASNEYSFRFTYDGEEELYLKDTKLNTLTLIDNENSYHFYSAPSDSDMRFIIVKNAPQNPTGVDKLGTDANVQKIMHDGVMYILRGGRIYDATGALVK